MVASSKEAVSKVLGELRAEGLAELGKRRIKVRDHDFLRSRAVTAPLSRPV